MSTTTLSKLSRIEPRSETHWREIAAKAHRLLNQAGDEAAAKTHELAIDDIRAGRMEGSSRELRLCPRCLERGMKYWLIWVAGVDRCGTCRWSGSPAPDAPVDPPSVQLDDARGGQADPDAPGGSCA